MLAKERRVLALNLVFGVFLIFVSLTNTYVSTPIFLSICGVAILGGMLLGNKREDRAALKKRRLEIFKSNPKLGWLNTLGIVVLPLAAGLLSYFSWELAGINSFYLTIGVMSVGAFLLHFITSPHLEKLELRTFD